MQARFVGGGNRLADIAGKANKSLGTEILL